MRKRQNKAFTIIELLISVGLIIVLISIMLPSLGQSRGTTDTTVCAQNQKAIYQVSYLYAIDHKRRWPSSWEWVSHDLYGLNAWHTYDSVKSGTLYGYLGPDADETRKCPAFMKVYKQFAGNANKEAAFTYAFNSHIGDRTWQGRQNIRTIDGVENPSELLLLCDENAWIAPGFSTYAINNGSMGVGPWTGGNVDAIGSMHNPDGGDLRDGFSNVTFCDGHVALHHISESKEIATPEMYKN